MVEKDYHIPTMEVTVDYKKPQSQQISRPNVKDKNTYPVSKWGVDNLEPLHILNDIKRTPALQAIFSRKAELLYGNGVKLGKVDGYDANGNEIIVPVVDEKVTAWLKMAGFNLYMLKAVNSFYIMENLFPEFIKSKDKKTIAAINLQKSVYCRWGKKSETDGLVKKMFLHSDWKTAGLVGKDAIILDVMNEYYPMEHFRDHAGYKMIYRYQNITEEDKEYYSVPRWNAVRNSKWLSVAQRIPEFKDSIFDKQMSIKYVINTDRAWWEWKYPEFKDLKHEARLEIMKKERASMEAMLSGENNAGKSIWTTGFTTAEGKQIKGLEITELGSRFGSNDYIEDVQEATSQLFLATNMPATLMGVSMGKKMGAGSGSDIREAYNMYVPSQKIYRDILLEPWHKAFEYNKFPSDLRLYFSYNTITTLDQHTETKTQNQQ